MTGDESTYWERINELIQRIPEVNCPSGCYDCCKLKTGELCFFLAHDIKDGKYKCAIYNRRPLLCRLFGAVDSYFQALKCPHGIISENPMTKYQLDRLVDQYFYINRRFNYNFKYGKGTWNEIKRESQQA